MQYAKMLLPMMIFLSFPIFGKSPCAKQLESAVHEMKDWEKYGIRRDSGKRVLFPEKCTPFMSSKKMIPLPKRQTGNNVSRMRYMGNDCRIYEWDSEGGLFEMYKPNSNGTEYTHLGEITSINGRELPDPIAKRNHKATDTGLPGYDMKKLCKDHQSGKIQKDKFAKNSKAKNLLQCF